jgi:hypothetical protein
MRTSWCVIVTSALVIVAGTTVNAPKDTRPPDALTTTVARNFQIVPDRDAGSSADFFGNDVSDAVTRYRLDDSGDLYEVHSPEIEIARLPSPKG